MRWAFMVVCLALAAPLAPVQATAESALEICQHLKDPGEAIAACSKIIAGGGEAGSLPFALLARGDAYRKLGDRAAALADYNESIRLLPDNYLAFLSRGALYSQADNLALAIADYSEVIRLKSEGVPSAYQHRGMLYAQAGDPTRAIADFTKVMAILKGLGLGPSGLIYMFRGGAYLQAGDTNRAVVDYTQAITGPGDYVGWGHWSRGGALFVAGSFAEAEVDFKKALAATPDAAEYALWLDIAQRRGKRPGSIAANKSRLDPDKWPAPIVRFFLGKATPDDVRAAANDPDPAERRGQDCYIGLFLGEYATLQGNSAEAQSALFQQAADTCNRPTVEHAIAEAELRRLTKK